MGIVITWRNRAIACFDRKLSVLQELAVYQSWAVGHCQNTIRFQRHVMGTKDEGPTATIRLLGLSVEMANLMIMAQILYISKVFIKLLLMQSHDWTLVLSIMTKRSGWSSCNLGEIKQCTQQQHKKTQTSKSPWICFLQIQQRRCNLFPYWLGRL
jgi:hypothetical protein